MGYYNSGFFAPKASVEAANRQRDFNEGQRKGRIDAPMDEKSARINLIHFEPSSRWPDTPYGRGYIAGARAVAEEIGNPWKEVEITKEA